ncbi:MAG: hypothetical protein ACO1OR_08300, partial [Hydrogenophaga sp.]
MASTVERSDFSVQGAGQVTYTLFASVSSVKSCRQQACTWAELVEQIRNAKTYSSKAQQPLIKLAAFGNRPNDKGSLRHDTNVDQVYGIEADYDAGQVLPAEAAERLKVAGVRAVIYTSASHTAAAPRWRVLAPLSAPVAPAERARYVSLLNGALGGVLAPESWVLSQTYYLGRVDGVEYEVHAIDGEPIDIVALTGDLVKVPPAVRVKAARVPMKKRSGKDAADPVVDYLYEHGWVTDVEPDGRLHVRCPWESEHTTDTGASSTTYFPAGVGGFDTGGFKCMHTHCAGRHVGMFTEAIGWVTQSFNVIMSPSEYAAAVDAGEVDEGPDGLPVLAADGATIDVIDGLDDPEQVAVRARNAAKADSAEVAARSVADIVDELRRLPRDQRLTEWVCMSVALPKDAAAEVVEQVSRLTGVGVRRLNAALADARARRARSAHESALARRIGDRLRLEWRPDDKTKLADKVEASILRRVAPDEYLQFGGVPARVVVKTLPGTQHFDDPYAVAPPVAHIEPLDQVGALALAERSVAFVEMRGETLHLIGIPQALLDILLLKKSHAAPAVSGLLVHPVVLRDGTILAEDGLHQPSGLFLKGAACPGARAYTQAEAVAALARIRGALLDGFEFDNLLSADAAVAGLFTGVQRRLLDQAPGLAVLAGAQASGKTTLARRLHLLLTGQDMPVASFPAGDEAEMQKRLLSLLLRSPAMVCFDNLADGTTFRSAALAAAMTGPVLSQRVLGVSRDADAPTNVLFVLTGNNLSLGADEATRWMVSRLAPTAARPEERQFMNADVVAHALKVRQAVLADVVGIVAGLLAYGTPQRPRTRFAQWDRMV